MNLINTDGVVLLGQGSEWFWTALSGIALVVTFLAIYRQLRLEQTQLRENTKILRSQAHHNAVTLGSRPLEMLIQDPGLAEIVTVGLATPESLSEADWFRCGTFILLQVNAWEYQYYQSRDGSIPAELWIGADAYFRDHVASRAGMRRFWGNYRETYADPFRSHVDSELAKQASEGTARQLAPSDPRPEPDAARAAGPPEGPADR